MSHPQIHSIFQKGSSENGALVIHGFTATPDINRSIIQKLNQKGFTVIAPLLAGHGRTPEQCAQTNWRDWYNSVEEAYFALKKITKHQFIVGHSLGGLLTLKMLIQYPNQFLAAGLLATPLFLARWIQWLLPVVWHSPIKHIYRFQKKKTPDIKDRSALANFWNYSKMPVNNVVSITELQKLIQNQLTQIETPLILMHAKEDSTAPYESMAAIASGVQSKITEMITLKNSYHQIPIDFEKEYVANKIYEFFSKFFADQK